MSIEYESCSYLHLAPTMDMSIVTYLQNHMDEM